MYFNSMFHNKTLLSTRSLFIQSELNISSSKSGQLGVTASIFLIMSSFRPKERYYEVPSVILFCASRVCLPLCTRYYPILIAKYIQMYFCPCLYKVVPRRLKRLTLLLHLIYGSFRANQMVVVIREPFFPNTCRSYQSMPIINAC